MTSSTSVHRTVSVLLVGHAASAGDALSLAAPNLSISIVDSLCRASDLLAAGALSEPELVVLAPSRPGQFEQAGIDILRRHAPLARFVRVGGSWCEGEARSGRPPAGCQAVYWHQWPARLGRALAAIDAGENPPWAQPATATADEYALSDSATVPPRAAGKIALAAAQASAAAALADLCRARGYEPAILAEHAPGAAPDSAALVWDTTAEALLDPRRVGRLRSRAGGAPLLAICGFVRPELPAEAAAAGIAQVVSKPYLVADLLWHLERVRR